MDNNELAYLQRALAVALSRYPVPITVKADLENTNEEDYVVILPGAVSLRREFKSRSRTIEYSVIQN
jgi:hypothetical protein